MSMSKQVNFEELKRFSAEIRKETVRAIGHAGFGHIGGSVSISDVLAVLYGGMMNIDPANPKWEDRDRLVLSKGHCGPGLYAVLALKGFFPMDWLKTVNKPGTNLPSHADGQKTPGVDMSTGSLGNGASSAVGIALGSPGIKSSLTVVWKTSWIPVIWKRSSAPLALMPEPSRALTQRRSGTASRMRRR